MSKLELKTKNHYIKLLRDNGFNCFPISKLSKIADSRYRASRTELNQKISSEENYGYIPIGNLKTAIIDIDHKEKYRRFAESMIKEGYMVIETGKGWHIPVANLTGLISKIELFDYEFQPDKKIVEIQGPDHYCVGPASTIYHEELKKNITYNNLGTDTIWNAKGMDFHDFIDGLCKNLNLEGRRKTSRSSYKNLRDRFQSGLLPTPNTSNDYFFQAAIQCRKDGLTQNEAQDKIKIVFDQWKKTAHYSGRPWANIETKINQVYESENFEQSDRLEKFVKTAQIALDFSSSRQIYSNVDTHDIFENKNGFLERINNNLKKELQVLYPTMSKENYNDILFKLEGLAKPIPETNKNLIVFKNGVLDRKQRKIIDTDEIADLGFKEFNYLKATESNKPKKFIEIMFSNVRLEEHPRIKAGLKAIFNNRLDSRISVIYGISGVGKSTPLSILVKILGQYALSVELDQFLKDRFIKAKIIGKRLVVLEDLPKDWKDFAQIKTVTGEAIKTERGFLQDSVQFENKIKIWASGNYLTKIPEHEKNAMYSRRLSLIHNDKTAQYVENPGLIDEVVRDEGEKIISWIVNLPEEECQYEDSFTVRTEWEAIASPEMEYLEENYEITEEIDKKIPVYSLVKNFRDAKKLPMDLKTMGHALESVGYIVHYNIIKNIQIKEKFLNKLA